MDSICLYIRERPQNIRLKVTQKLLVLCSRISFRVCKTWAEAVSSKKLLTRFGLIKLGEKRLLLKEILLGIVKFFDANSTKDMLVAGILQQRVTLIFNSPGGIQSVARFIRKQTIKNGNYFTNVERIYARSYKKYDLENLAYIISKSVDLTKVNLQCLYTVRTF